MSEKESTKIEEIKKEELTYLDHLLDEMGHSAVGKNLPLRGLVVEQYVEGCILVGVCPLVERTRKMANKVRLCPKQSSRSLKLRDLKAVRIPPRFLTKGTSSLT